MVLLKSEEIEMGTPAPTFELPGTDGRTYCLDDFEGARALVVVFMCNHCPYVQEIWDDLVKLQAQFEAVGVRFVGVNPDIHPDYPEETFEKMQEYYERYEMNFPYLIDESQEIAREYGAVCTPDIFVYDSDFKLAYHGAVDAEVLQQFADKGKFEGEQKHSMGCSIKWRE